MAPFWFLAGVLCTLTAIVLVLPWLRTLPGLGPLPVLSWRVGGGAVLVTAGVLGSILWLGPADHMVEQPAPLVTEAGGKVAGASHNTADSWAGIENALRGGAGSLGSTAGPAPKAGAEPMISAITSLQKRLARSGGTADDWELLAKSYEFLGRGAEARKVRAHQLPPLPSDDNTALEAAGPQTSSAGSEATGSQTSSMGSSPAVVSGEVSLAPALAAKAAAGSTLFIVAKSVDSPGAPVAVFRTSVGSWPVKFDLGDSQSMLPGRTLSGAGRVTVEARISQTGQPLPAAGDLQGSTGIINPADHWPLRILIDKVIK